MTVNEGCPVCQGRCCEYGVDDYRGAHRSEAFHTCPYCADGTKPPSTLQRLEEWTLMDGHTVVIYNPCNWEIHLSHEEGVTHALEVPIIPATDARWSAYLTECESKGVVFAEGKGVDKPGLEATIKAALDAFDRGVWGPQ